MKGGLVRFLLWPFSRNALNFSVLPRMCLESRLPRGSKFCTCPRYMAMRVSLWAVPVVDVCLRVSLLCGCPRHLSTQVALRPVPLAGLCGPGVTCFPVGLPSGPSDRSGTPRWSYPSHRYRGGPLLVKPRTATPVRRPGRELAGWEHRRH